MNRPMLPAPGSLVFGAVMLALSIVAMFHTRRCERRQSQAFHVDQTTVRR